MCLWLAWSTSIPDRLGSIDLLAAALPECWNYSCAPLCHNQLTPLGISSTPPFLELVSSLDMDNGALQDTNGHHRERHSVAKQRWADAVRRSHFFEDGQIKDPKN